MPENRGDGKTTVSITLNERTVDELREGFPASIDLAESVRMAITIALDERGHRGPDRVEN